MWTLQGTDTRHSAALRGAFIDSEAKMGKGDRGRRAGDGEVVRRGVGAVADMAERDAGSNPVANDPELTSITREHPASKQ